MYQQLYIREECTRVTQCTTTLFPAVRRLASKIPAAPTALSVIFSRPARTGRSLRKCFIFLRTRRPTLCVPTRALHAQAHAWCGWHCACSRLAPLQLSCRNCFSAPSTCMQYVCNACAPSFVHALHCRNRSTRHTRHSIRQRARGHSTQSTAG